MTRTLLIDGDIIIYKAACVAQQDFEVPTTDEDDTFLCEHWRFGNKQLAIQHMEEIIDTICKKTHSQDCVIALSDTNGNFRKKINPKYKKNRKAPKPILHQFLRDYFIKAGYKTFVRPNLEGDDILGILATSDKIIKGDKVIYSFDKDFKTVPCKFRREFPDGSHESMTITEEEADWWFMYQTLVGDITDNYKGCHKIGDKLAKKILGEVGEKSLAKMWEVVMQTFIQHGSSEENALLNARMARILRASDYDFKNKEVKLWNPPTTTR